VELGVVNGRDHEAVLLFHKDTAVLVEHPNVRLVLRKLLYKEPIPLVNHSGHEVSHILLRSFSVYPMLFLK
jgi:hypothetical protein